MLILTRRTGETLHIGDDIKVTILNVTGSQVRIGIDAPQGDPCTSRGDLPADCRRARECLAINQPGIKLGFLCCAQGDVGVIHVMVLQQSSKGQIPDKRYKP